MGTLMSFSNLNSFQILTFLLLLSKVASQKCGSLVTYRQHADLLQNAPKCLHDGCTAGQNASTISSPCSQSSPCYVYWNMFVEQFDQKHSWCSNCASDLACRIDGWPVLNATAVCDSTPNQLLFGGEKSGCCLNDDEPFQLANWTGKLCNGSEWRQPFDICGGMACKDWHEWIMPWNWTVQSSLVPPDQQKCTPPSKYLGVYGIEQFFWLFCSIFVGCIRLLLARHEEETNNTVVRYWAISFWRTIRFKQNGKRVELEGEHLRPPWTDKLAWGFPVVMGLFMAGAELGFNFLAAWLVQRKDGYNHIPMWKLALLFCCRPRLSWLSCVLALLSKDTLVKIFRFRPGGDGLWAAKLVLSSVAVTSAVTEATMQLLGAYFLGRTAQIGTERGFYYIHHLRPKLHGRDARHMYLGALFWVMVCIPLLAVWFVVALFYTQVYHKVASWRRDIFHWLRPKAENLPKPLARGAVIWALDNINPDPTGAPRSKTQRMPSIRGGDGQVMPADSDQPMRLYNDSPYDQPMPYGGPGTGDLFGDDSQPMPVLRTSPLPRSPYSPLSQQDLDDQIMPIPRAASGSGYVHTPVHGSGSVQRRAPSGSGNQYSSLPQHVNEDDDDDQAMAVPSSSSHRRLHTPEMSEIHRPGRAQDSRYTPLSVTPGTYQSTDNIVPPSTSGSGSGSSRRRRDYPKGVTRTFEEWEPLIVFAGFFLGLLSFASQWLFWDGFVKAAGDKFCPPNVLHFGGAWWAASLLYVGFPFFGY
ncbi:uncharacterized protein BDR25DRAFT_60805 [Lindgomyces ingoldianus]|uniref:Uncharacterized protein n=1 Tax=Lindgomyces ingoldianus TaxID=673940 RepID=A0ACB6QPD2_9PLEO|nr:uncharacterized protein BDR25DRAFT_60805 [Lindgomyces ingoldianus]KAF2467962.1 hypothetical protein BDR25DRAFT_60805 [Lindgomyces ingoldianus]